ncbi:TspO/MBR family protein [Pleionea sediminis]|uniref:TspO/MBR family protein n=1 Tax=Pleionea sediminis TaxID=2569479 RepID=UPI00197BD91C|nr:TspO/MBR family protein [Pleionea sediminis]
MNKPLVRNILGLFGWLILCFAASFLGAIGSLNAPTFYGQLMQPDWSPPTWVFGPVWTLLYTLMAIAAWQIWRNGGFKENKLALILFLVQLVLNALWSWIFFSWQMGGFAFFEIVALAGFIIATILAFYEKSRWASLLLVPYVLWVAFAAFLNFTLWTMNPEIL